MRDSLRPVARAAAIPGELKRDRAAAVARWPSLSDPDPATALGIAGSAAGGPRDAGAFFEQVHGEFASRMRGVALRITRNEADAEDAVQDALLRVLERHETFRRESSLWTWLYRITENCALMIVRKRARRSRLQEEMHAGLQAGLLEARNVPTPEQHLVRSRFHRAVKQEVDALRFSLRSLMHDLITEGVTARTLAERHGLTRAAAKLRIHRARVTLRDRLRAWRDP